MAVPTPLGRARIAPLMMKKQKSSKKAASPKPVPTPSESDPTVEAEPAPSADTPAPPPADEPDVGALQQRLLRLQADFENFRRRTQRERSETYRRANEDLLHALLPVLDHFELGFENADPDDNNESVIDGFRMIFQQTLAALGKFGVEPMEAEGHPFDPHLHEAVTHVPSDDVPADSVVAQTRRGYMLGDRLLRPAQVVVSSGPVPEPAAEEGEPAIQEGEN